jgi:hypothetical protein
LSTSFGFPGTLSTAHPQHPPRIAVVSPLIVIAAGAVALIAGIGVLLSYGSRYRVGRLLAATPKVSVDEALALASAGDRRYVRVDGRLDSETDFPDEHHQPLVYRRRRLQLRQRGQWRSLDDSLEVVPFEVREGLSGIGIDHAALDQGLVVLPRESTGTAGEIPDHLPAGTPPGTPARMRIEQLSNIEHAIVLGVPAQVAGAPQMTAGLGRPLVITTLEIPEAMRILGGGRGRPTAVLVLLGLGGVLVVIGTLWALLTMLR